MNNKKILSLLLAASMIGTSLGSIQSSAAEHNTNTVTIDVTEYGADPTGLSDSAPAIQEAIAAAKENSDNGKEVIIEFPKGEYDIYPDQIEAKELYISNTVGADQSYKNKKIGIFLEDMNNVTIDGNGSVFMYHGKMTTLAAINCENITFTDFTVDFQVPTVIDITVEKIEGNTATIYVPECYNYEINGTSVKWLSDVSPYTGEPYWSATNNMNYTQIYDTVSGLTWRAGNPVFSGVTSIEDLGNHRLKFTYSSAPLMNVGYCYQMRPTVRDHSGTFFWKSKDVTLENLDIHFLHGFGMVGQHSENFVLNDVDFETPASTGRTTAGYADFIQMSGCKGKIEISNCTFANPHDDPINIHGTFNKVVEKISSKKIKVRYMHNETAGFPNYFVGDQVEFMTAGNMIPVENSVRTIVAVDGPDGQGGIMGEGSGSLTDIILTFDKEIPGEVAVNTHVVENITYTPEVHIHDNIFKETPTRGILVTTRQPVLIEDNYFDGMGMAGIYISNDAQGWWESGPTKDVTIRNNVFTRGKSQAILVEPTNPSVSATRTVHSNMTIEGNTFFMENQQVLSAKSVGNLNFRNNRIYRLDPNVTVTAAADRTSLKTGETAVLSAKGTANTLGTRLYYFNGCKNVVLEGNRYDDGLNVGSSYSNMQAADITITDDAAVKGGNNSLSAVGKISYESSDESVVTVSANGTVTAVGKGTATVSAYVLAAGRRYDGNSITFTVTAGETAAAPTAITVVAETEVIAVGETAAYTAEVAGPAAADKTVRWSVIDAKTGEVTTAATINENGILTSAEGGVVEVVAKTVNGLESRKLLVIQSQGYALEDSFEVANASGNAADVKAEEGAVVITVNGTGLYQEQSPANIVKTAYNGDSDQVTVTVKVDGRAAVGGSNWAAIGLYLMKDVDNYVSVEKKYRGAQGIAYGGISETSQRATEVLSNIQSDVNSCYLKLVKSGNIADAYYSLDGTAWTEIKTGMYAGQLGDHFSIGLAALGDGAKGCEFTFSELTVNGTEVSMTGVAVKPSVSSAVMNYDAKENKAVVQSEENTVIKWAAADTENGNYSLIANAEGNELLLTAALKNKYLKAAVVPCGSAELFGDPVWTSAVLVTGDGADDETVIAKSSNSQLKTADISGLENSFGRFDSKQLYYFTTAGVDEETVQVHFEAAHKNAVVNITVNGKEFSAEENAVQLTSGRNTIEVTVYAEDGITFSVYRFVISRIGDSNTNLSVLRVGNDRIVLEENVYQYTYRTEKDNVEIFAETVSERASIEIFVNGELSADNTAALKKGANKIVLQVTSETSAAPTYYTVFVITPESDKVLKSIKVVSAPEKTKYNTGELFDASGLVLNLAYADGTSKQVAYSEETAAYFSFTPAGALELTDKTVTVIYGYEALKTSLSIKVKEPLDPADDSNDYPVEGLTATAGTLELTEGSLEALFDGDPNSFYHSNWSGTRPTDKDFWIIIELPEVTEVSGLRYLPRQGSPNGRILSYEISYSVDGNNWTEAVSGNWEDDYSWKAAEFAENAAAKYVKIFATDSKADTGGRHMTAAELRLFFIEEEEEPVVPEIPEDEVCRIFTDVEHGAWYEDSVQFVYDMGILVGNGNEFTPNADTTRAMVAMILYRMEGSPAVTDYTKYDQFSDVAAVKEHIWYTDAVAWALNTGVATGDDQNMLYNPNAAVTREQLATFLHRYAEYAGLDVTVEGSYEDLFGDTYVNEWAKAGFAWAVENDIIKGAEATDNAGNVYTDLNPQGNATRAQLATILCRCLTGVTN